MIRRRLLLTSSSLLLIISLIWTQGEGIWNEIWNREAKALVPSGVIVAWPDTAASIPSGWTRVTALDATYVRGVPNGSTDPGTTGGATTHSHTTSAHGHTISHTHSSATSGTPTGTASILATSNVDAADTAHTHTSGTITAATDTSGTASPSSGSTSNDPANLAVIWIQSDGSPSGIPDGALAIYNNDTLPTNWVRYTNSEDRFLKGAAASGDGGGTGGAATHAHTGEGSHTHASDHVHPDSTSGGGTNLNNSHAAGTAAALDTHTHTVSTDSNNFGTSNSQTLTTSTDNHEPPWEKQVVMENQTGGNDLQIGTIAVWRGTLASIPTGWVLADGGSGTPNLLGDFVKGVATTGQVNNTGGATSHSHTGSNHTHTWSSTSHTHTVNFGGTASSLVGTSTGTTRASTTHTHSATSGASNAVTVGNAAPDMASATSLPPYEEVAYIYYEGVATPSYTQNDFEWFVTADSVTLSNIWPAGSGNNLAENATMTQIPAGNEPLKSGDRVRIQMNFTVATATLAATTQAFKLWYDTATDCTTASGWTAVGAKASGAIWRLFDESSIGDSTAQVNDISTSTSSAEGYYSEINASGTNPNEVLTTENSEWDWPVENNGAADNTTYCFRMTLSDNTAFGTYNADSFPKLTTAPGTANLLKHGNIFSDGSEKGFFWAN